MSGIKRVLHVQDFDIAFIATQVKVHPVLSRLHPMPYRAIARIERGIRVATEASVEVVAVPFPEQHLQFVAFAVFANIVREFSGHC